MRGGPAGPSRCSDRRRRCRCWARGRTCRATSRTYGAGCLRRPGRVRRRAGPPTCGAPGSGRRRTNGPLRAEVEGGAAGVHVRERGGRFDCPVLGRVETDEGSVASRAHGFLGTLGDGIAVPGARSGERTVEAGDRVDGVRLGVLAEATAGDGGAHRAVVEDLDLGGDRPVQRLPRVEQDVGLVRGREGVALHPGPGGRGQLGLDAGLQVDPVRAGARPLAFVAELRLVLGVVRLGDLTRGRQHGQVAAQAAADAREVDEGEAADVILGVVVAGVVAGVRRELHHAEGHGCARVGVAFVLRSDERVDQIGERGARRDGRPSRRNREGAAEEDGGRHHHPRIA